jgi:hypothetical protein
MVYKVMLHESWAHQYERASNFIDSFIFMNVDFLVDQFSGDPRQPPRPAAAIVVQACPWTAAPGPPPPPWPRARLLGHKADHCVYPLAAKFINMYACGEESSSVSAPQCLNVHA